MPLIGAGLSLRHLPQIWGPSQSIVGNLFAIANTDAASGSALVGVTDGVFILPKKPAAVIAAGGRVSWDNTAHQCDVLGAGLYPVGVAV